MNDALARMRWIEEQIRELANGLDWLDEPVDDERERSSALAKTHLPDVFQETS